SSDLLGIGQTQAYPPRGIGQGHPILEPRVLKACKMGISIVNGMVLPPGAFPAETQVQGSDPGVLDKRGVVRTGPQGRKGKTAFLALEQVGRNPAFGHGYP